ncbi:conserved protein of unknown function [Burkholderia multivorans]
MAKTMETPVLDARADSTADQPPAALDPLAAIAEEALAEDDAQREKVERAEQDAADAEAQARLEGWREVTTTAQDLITAPFPGLKPVWTSERMERLAVALAVCDERYGWGGAGVIKNSPLLLLGIASFPIAVGTVQYVKVEKARAQAAALAARQQAERAELAPGLSATPAAAPAAPDAQPPRKERPLDVAGGIDTALGQHTYAQ